MLDTSLGTHAELDVGIHARQAISSRPDSSEHLSGSGAWPIRPSCRCRRKNREQCRQGNASLSGKDPRRVRLVMTTVGCSSLSTTMAKQGGLLPNTRRVLTTWLSWIERISFHRLHPQTLGLRGFVGGDTEKGNWCWRRLKFVAGGWLKEPCLFICHFISLLSSTAAWSLGYHVSVSRGHTTSGPT